MLNAAQDSMSSNPFQALSGGNNSSESGTTGPASTSENAAPLPNPWGGGTNSGSGSGGTTSGSGSSGTSGRQGLSNHRLNHVQYSKLSWLSVGSGLFSSPGMQSLLSQMSDNPQLMQNMMNAPYTQSMFQTLAQNPDMASSIISSNPLFAGNPQLAEQMRNMMPTFVEQLQNPAVQVNQQVTGQPRIGPECSRWLVSFRTWWRTRRPCRRSCRSSRECRDFRPRLLSSTLLWDSLASGWEWIWRRPREREPEVHRRHPRLGPVQPRPRRPRQPQRPQLLQVCH